jgi:5-methylcytosine-specific restriction endonuclease McrA
MSVPGLGKRKPRLRRDWRAAREKIEREGHCRACGRTGTLEAAHILSRRHDYDIASANARNILVLPDRIVPLCRTCHERDHRGELEWLPLLSRAEEVQAVADVGIEGAMQRLSPGYNPRRHRLSQTGFTRDDL